MVVTAQLFLVIKMAQFRKLALISLLAGILAGLLLTILQHYLTQPLIFAAEQLEVSTPQHSHEWQPAEGFQRNFFTFLFNTLTGFGFSLLLSAGMYLKNHNGYLRGLAWGLAGYAVFFIAPALGLPPELPGTESAALLSRQTWWLFTALLTAGGLFCSCFGETRNWKLSGLILLVVPHLIGAPQPDFESSLASEVLQQQFVIFSAFNNGVFWLVLGAVAGMLLKKIEFNDD
jgi:cobalt transporter subunit CbtA